MIVSVNEIIRFSFGEQDAEEKDNLLNTVDFIQELTLS